MRHAIPLNCPLGKMLQHLHNALMGSFPPFHCDVATTAIRIRKWKFQGKQRAEFNSNVNNGGENVL